MTLALEGMQMEGADEEPANTLGTISFTLESDSNITADSLRQSAKCSGPMAITEEVMYIGKVTSNATKNRCESAKGDSQVRI
jgi:hypothetical protein